MDTLRKEFMRVVTKEKEFVSHDESKLKAHFGMFGLSKLRSREVKK